MKNHIYISLGAACDVAGNLNYVGLRHRSYPFDWLWNLDQGLEAVIQIFQDDFQDITQPCCYVEQSHYRFPEPMVVYKAYPTIAHLHTNPLQDKDAHKTLCRRVDRLREEMNKDTVKHFVYYRNFSEGILLKEPTLSPEDIFQKLLSEGESFMDMLQQKYPLSAKTSSLLLVLQVPASLSSTAHDLVSKYQKSIRKNDKYQSITLAYNICRDDKDLALKKQWKTKWIALFFTKTQMPFLMMVTTGLRLFMVRSRMFLGRIKQPLLQLFSRHQL